MAGGVLDTIKGWMPDWSPTDPETGLKYEKRSTDPTVLEMQKAKKAQEDEEARQRNMMTATGGAQLSDKAKAQMATPEGQALMRAQGGSPEDAAALRARYGEEGSGDWLTDLQRGVAQTVAPKGALDAAEAEIGTPSSIGAKPLSPENQAAYSPAKSEVMQRNEDPAGATIQDATKFGQEQAQKAAAEAASKQSGVLDGKAEEAQRSDFGAGMASKIATIATFGAMIATGVGIPFALAAAGAAWAGTGDMRSREEDAKEMYKKGYNSMEINNYVHKGVLPEVPSAMKIQMANDKLAAANAKGAKGLTEQQAKAQFGADRALASQNRWVENYGNISDNVKDYPIATLPAMYMDEVSDWKPGMVPAALKAVYPEIIKARDNEMGYLAGVLRPESGSAIGLGEWKNYGHIYFPRRGDTKESVRQKEWLRDMTVQSLYNLAQSGNMSDRQGEDVVQNMAGLAGKVRDYNREQKAVKLSDGHWYAVADLAGGDPTHRK
ncbi:hypothetical protein TacPo2_56 [Pantoea bacteriophage TacPo2]